MAASVFFRTPLYDCSWWICSAVKVVKEQPRSEGYSVTVLEKYVLTPVSTIYFPVSFAKFLRTSPMAASVFFRTPLYDCSWCIYSAVKVVKEQPRNKGYSTTVLEKYDLKRKDG